MRRALLVTLCALTCLLAPARGAADHATQQAVQQAIDELRLEDAAQLWSQLSERDKTDARGTYMDAMLRLHRGDYAGAKAAFDAAAQRAGEPSFRAECISMRALSQNTQRTTQRFVQTRSADGRYVVLHAASDQMLAAYALETLKEADRALSVALGVRVPGPIRLEIYQSPRALAGVSSLSVEDIERTGTIALSKWDRLMIASPEALARGYGWQDTIAHELTHLILARASRNHAPVWVHEGIARYLERSWRAAQNQFHLDAHATQLLTRAQAQGRLLAFARLHPSIALLPSQQDAALAFAQVSTFMQTFVQAHGPDAMRRAITYIANGMDAQRAFSEAAGGQSFDALEARWKQAIAAMHAPEAPSSALPMRFAGAANRIDDAEDVPLQARRALRLGDLLWNRERQRAALVEYARGVAAAPGDPILTTRMARAAIMLRDPQRAVAPLQQVTAAYPDYAPGWSLYARASADLGHFEQILPAARNAIGINPFDPDPHCLLAEHAESEHERARETAYCAALRETH